MSNCYRYTALSYDAIDHKVTITIQAPQHAHTRIIISILYTHYIHQAACGERRFSQTLVQAPVIRIPPSYHVRKGNKVPCGFAGYNKERPDNVPSSPACELESNLLWELPLLVFLRSGVPITITTPNHTPVLYYVPFPLTLPHHVLRAGGCKTSDVIFWLQSTPIIESSVLSEVLI